jgi:hypothetical protein
MRNQVTLLAGVVAGAFSLAGCEVEKTKDGNVTIPEYEVSQTREGDVTLPAYEVTTPDITVEEKTVEVTVPDIDVKTASEKKAEQAAGGN